MADRFIVGDTLQLYLTVATLAGVATDPAGLTLRVKAPSGAVTVYVYGTAAEVIRDGAGDFHADIPATAAGIWAWRWEATGSVPGVEEGAVMVSASRVL